MTVIAREQTWDLLAEVLAEVVYTRDPPPGDRFKLVRDDAGNYSVLYIFTRNPNTYRPDEMRHTRHEFLVPVATYHKAAWLRWVFDRIASIELHETCESFQVRDESLCQPDCSCQVCAHQSTHHDGRDSSCEVGPCVKHRFICETGHSSRLYAPHHGNGWDPYTIWYGSHPKEQTKAPGSI